MGSSNLSKIFDPVRKTKLVATPEEKVRQAVLHHLIHELSFPKESICVEKELKSLPHLSQTAVPDRRVDILCFSKGEVVLMIECKKEKLLPKDFDQLIGYNYYVKAPYIALIGDHELLVNKYDRTTKIYSSLSRLPTYSELLCK